MHGRREACRSPQLFKATSELLPAEQTIPTFYVPNAASFSVADGAKVDVNEVLAKHDDVTCLTVSFSGLGLPNQDLSQWQSKFLADFGSKPGYRLVNLKYMDGFEYYFAPGFFTNMVKGALAPEVQEHSIAVFEPYHYNITVRACRPRRRHVCVSPAPLPPLRSGSRSWQPCTTAPTASCTSSTSRAKLCGGAFRCALALPPCAALHVPCLPAVLTVCRRMAS